MTHTAGQWGVLGFVIGASIGSFLSILALVAALRTGWSGYPGWGGMAVLLISGMGLIFGVIGGIIGHDTHMASRD